VSDFQLSHRPRAELADERGERLLEGLGLQGETDEDTALPDGHRHGLERVVVRAEGLHLIHERRADERTIERIGPGVVGALNGLGELALWLGEQPRPAVSAHVVVRAQLTV